MLIPVLPDVFRNQFFHQICVDMVYKEEEYEKDSCIDNAVCVLTTGLSLLSAEELIINSMHSDPLPKETLEALVAKFPRS